MILSKSLNEATDALSETASFAHKGIALRVLLDLEECFQMPSDRRRRTVFALADLLPFVFTIVIEEDFAVVIYYIFASKRSE